MKIFILSSLLTMTLAISLSAQGLGFDDKGPIYEARLGAALEPQGEVTIEAWIQADPMGGGGGRIVDKSLAGEGDTDIGYHAPNKTGFVLDTFPGNGLRFMTSTQHNCQADVHLPADQWTYVAAVYSASRKIMKIYVDGQEAARVDQGDFPPLAWNESPLRIGANQEGGDRFHGRIKAVAVYLRALSADEIAQRNADSPPLPDAAAAWTFDGPPADVVPPAVGAVPLREPLQVSGGTAAPEEPLSLWYRRPAARWVEAIPLGNGRLGAMDYGGVDREILKLNEDTFWSGGPYDPNPDAGAAQAALAKVRQLVFADNYDAAKGAAGPMMGRPPGQMSYQPVGDLRLDFPGERVASDYRRDLNLDTAIETTTFKRDGVTYKREVFASAPSQVIVIRLSADQPGRIGFTASFATPQKAEATVEGGDTLALRGAGPEYRGVAGALTFASRVKIVPDGGTLTPGKDSLTLAGADSAILLLDIGTSFKNYHDVTGDPDALTQGHLAAAAKATFDSLRDAHVADYRRLFRRVALDLGTTGAAQEPTDERLRDFAKGPDPQLVALYFDYGRYLLISSSRPGGQPANLQGIWNMTLQPPWDSKMTININTQMNYWPAEATNLSECAGPLFDMIKDISETGVETARTLYNARGWMAHHNTDLWRATAPVDWPSVGIWPMGGAWLCTHLWEHYQFTGDKDFLKNAYPILKGASLFFVDTLVPEPTHGWLVTNPSNSPEHGPGRPEDATLVAGPTMDLGILRDLFAQTAAASQILGIDEDFRKEILDKREKLAPFQIGRHGQLQEWLEDKDDPNDHHRHVSHLYAVFPSHEINPATPDLFAAAKQSLIFRGDAGTGWSSAWKINLWARFLDGEHAYKILSNLISNHTYPNLFDAHPPFQIDGNFGATSGIAEMLLQSQNGSLDLLPALPGEWPKGSITGLRARNGFQVDLAWADGKLSGATIHSDLGNPCRVSYAGKSVDLAIKAGESLRIGPDLEP